MVTSLRLIPRDTFDWICMCVGWKMWLMLGELLLLLWFWGEANEEVARAQGDFLLLWVISMDGGKMGNLIGQLFWFNVYVHLNDFIVIFQFGNNQNLKEKHDIQQSFEQIEVKNGNDKEPIL